MMKPAVELKLFRRTNGTQYFEVWVRSSARPQIQRASIVERDFREAAQVELLAGAIAEGLAESYGDQRSPSEVARAAREAYYALNLTNPRPGVGSVDPIG